MRAWRMEGEDARVHVGWGLLRVLYDVFSGTSYTCPPPPFPTPTPIAFPGPQRVPETAGSTEPSSTSALRKMWQQQLLFMSGRSPTRNVSVSQSTPVPASVRPWFSGCRCVGGHLAMDGAVVRVPLAQRKRLLRPHGALSSAAAAAAV